MALFEGEVIGKVVNPEIGNDKGSKPRVRWSMTVTEGEHKGKTASYSGKLDTENIKYTKRDMIAIGWKGLDVRTFVDDVKAANLTLPFTAEIASNTYSDTGKTSEWTSVRRIGGGGAPLSPLDSAKANDVNQWFASAGDESADKATTDNADIPF